MPHTTPGIKGKCIACWTANDTTTNRILLNNLQTDPLWSDPLAPEANE